MTSRPAADCTPLTPLTPHAHDKDASNAPHGLLVLRHTFQHLQIYLKKDEIWVNTEMCVMGEGGVRRGEAHVRCDEASLAPGIYGQKGFNLL